jgi:hypothetical protein
VKQTLFALAALLTLIVAIGPAKASPDTPGGQFNNCTAASYGGSYDWLQFTNNCGQATYIQWFWKNNDYSGSGGTAQSGGTVSTGMTKQEVANNGGYELYICPAGSIPVNGSGAAITNGGSNPQQYKCKHQ